MLIGGDHLARLDALRQDQAGAWLRVVPEVPAPETASLLLPRFWQHQCEAAVATIAEIGNELDRRLGLPRGEPVTLDPDSTITEVYGRQQQGCSYNHEGKLSYGSEVCTWAGPLRRALAVLPQGHGPVHTRMDAGLFFAELMNTCRRLGVTFSISLPRQRHV
jgi:hypothetical protein